MRILLSMKRRMKNSNVFYNKFSITKKSEVDCIIHRSVRPHSTWNYIHIWSGADFHFPTTVCSILFSSSVSLLFLLYLFAAFLNQLEFYKLFYSHLLSYAFDIRLVFFCNPLLVEIPRTFSFHFLQVWYLPSPS